MTLFEEVYELNLQIKALKQEQNKLLTLYAGRYEFSLDEVALSYAKYEVEQDKLRSI